jgi:hypothetical protein
LAAIPPKTVNGRTIYTWENAKIIPLDDPESGSDVLAQDGPRFTLLHERRNSDIPSPIQKSRHLFPHRLNILGNKFPLHGVRRGISLFLGGLNDRTAKAQTSLFYL